MGSLLRPLRFSQPRIESVSEDAGMLGGPGPARAFPKERGSRGKAVAQADVLSPEGSSAICVQRFDGSRDSAIHTTYRISLRSSSLHEPSYPLLRVVFG